MRSTLTMSHTQPARSSTRRRGMHNWRSGFKIEVLKPDTYLAQVHTALRVIIFKQITAASTVNLDGATKCVEHSRRTGNVRNTCTSQAPDSLIDILTMSDAR